MRRRGLVLILLLGCLGCRPPPENRRASAPSPEPTPAPAVEPATHEGLSAAELLALPDDAEYHAWTVDPDAPVKAPPSKTPRYSADDLPRDPDGQVWWPLIPPRHGADAPALMDERHTALRWADRPFTVPNDTKSWRGERPTDEQLARWVPPVTAALRQYPRPVLEAVRLQHIVLTRALTFRGRHTNGTMVSASGVMLMNTDTFRDATPREIERAIHHEIFHALDYADDGDLWNDPTWDALNAADFRYGGGGRTMQETKGAGAWDADREGFLTLYATSGNEEDKAETFSWMMTELPRVEERAEGDPVLRSKVARIQELVAAFHPDLDPGFWSIRRIQGGRAQ